MKKISFLTIALAAIAMVSCQKEKIAQDGDATVKMTFTASMDDTKTYIDGTQVKWSATDEVAIYDGVCAEAHTFTVADGAGTTQATLTGTACPSTAFQAVYPASAAKGLAEGNVTLAVPAVQTAGENGLDQAALLMTAQTEDQNLSFRNVNGIIKITVDVDGVKQIVIRSNDATALAGTAVVAPATGEVSSVSEAASVVVLNPAGATFAQGDYYIAALPASVAGITLNAFTTENKVYAKKGTATFNLQRSHVLPIGGLSGTEAKDLLPASLAEATSSTLAITLPTISGASRLALYEDAACTKLVVAHNVPADNASKLNDKHRFVFAGLEQNKTYYFILTNAEGVPSAVVEAKTAAFNVVTVPETASAGDVVLAEDFGELSIFGAYGNYDAAGWAPYSPDSAYQADFRFPVPSGEQTQYYFLAGNEPRLFCMLRDAIPHSRLADWAEWNESNTGTVCGHSGHLKIGAGGVIGRIVTPEMSFVPANKTATVKVTFTGTRLDADSPVVQVVTGNKVQAGSGAYLDPYNYVIAGVLDEKAVTVQQNKWASYTVEVSKVAANSRIAIGTKRNNSTGNQRFLISDVKVELVSYSDKVEVTAPVVKLDATAFSDAKLSWNAVDGADSYKVYVNGSLNTTVDVPQCVVKGLQNGNEYEFKVEALNDFSAAMSEPIQGRTHGLRKSTQSTGTTFLCIDWDSVLRTRNDGKEQAYQVQICEDQACTKVIYDFVPHTGQKQTNPVFGNSSYYGRTKQLQDGIECANILTPTRVSVGGFYPNTTYYVRIRTLASATVKNCTSKGGTVSTITITNAFGTSEWSEVVAMTTDSEASLGSNVLFYTGFNDFCSQADYKGFAPGAVPFCFLANKDMTQCWIPWNHASRDRSIGLTFYCAGDGQHQTNTFNFTKDGAYVNGQTKHTESNTNYLVGRDKGSVNAITGDVAGWHFHQWCRPFMGMCGLDGNYTSVATPVIPAGKVDAEGSDCVISFSAVARVRPDDNYSGSLKVRVWRAATSAFEEIGTVTAAELIPYVAGSPKEEFKADFTGHFHTFTAKLYAGDAVEIYNTKAGIVLVDDFQVALGTSALNIDNLNRNTVNW